MGRPPVIHIQTANEQRLCLSLNARSLEQGQEPTHNASFYELEMTPLGLLCWCGWSMQADLFGGMWPLSWRLPGPYVPLSRGPWIYD